MKEVLKLWSFFVFICILLGSGAKGFLARKENYDKSFKDHPCRRECKQGESFICSYEIVVDYLEVFGPQCQYCLDDPRACQDEGCVYADGVSNIMMTMNNLWPAPAIEVCENDVIDALVINRLDENTTMHWHGLHMSQSKDMDGAPFITQNPIVPGGTYRYTFPVDRSGTIWYHSHMFWQRALGVAGSLVIRQPKHADPYTDLYDYDRSEHTIVITDMIYNSDISQPRNILINGRGRNHLNSWPDHDPRHHYERLTVSHGQRYRMRFISNGVANCPIKVSIDNHKLLVIATDGNDMEPILAESFFLTSAERLDIILEANQNSGSYWINFKGHSDCARGNLYQNAILDYEESEPANGIFSETNKREYSARDPLPQVNILAELMTKEKTRALQVDEIPTVGLRSLNPLSWPSDTTFTTYYKSFGLLRANGRAYLQVDDITFENPHHSLLQANWGQNEELCNRETFARDGIDCTTTNCECTNVVQMSFFKPIELIVVNFMTSTHPFHLHGFTFRVVGQDVWGNATELRNIRELDQRGLLNRVPDDYPAIEKDTVQIPPLGYIIMRFISDNTGYWLLHCHIERHGMQGMAGVVYVGEDDTN